jgi:hypothetical protein
MTMCPERRYEEKGMSLPNVEVEDLPAKELAELGCTMMYVQLGRTCFFTAPRRLANHVALNPT